MGKDTTEFEGSRNRPTRREVFCVPFENLAIMDDFNVRYDLGDITELANSIAENGVKVPLRGFKKGETYFITDGHRRYAAMQLLAKKGYTGIQALIVPEGKGYNEEDRTLDLLLANDGKRLTMLEEAIVFKRLLGYHWKTKDIAKRSGKSLTHVDNCLLLLSAPADLLEKIKKDIVAPSTVVEMLRKKDGTEVAQEIEAAEEKLQATGSKRKKVTAKDMEKKPKRNISKDLAKLLDEVKTQSPDNVTIHEDNLIFAERLLQYYNGELDYNDMKALFYETVEEDDQD